MTWPNLFMRIDRAPLLAGGRAPSDWPQSQGTGVEQMLLRAPRIGMLVDDPG
jgi:hypothetical protein